MENEKKFVIKILKKKKWEEKIIFKTYEEAKKECIAIVKKKTRLDEYYSEPNGNISEGFFGDNNPKSNWICMIDKEE